MFNPRLFLLLFIIGLSINSLNAQNRIIKSADLAFSQERYKEAIAKYLKGFKKLKNNKIEKERVNIQIAISYYKMGDLRRAKSSYSLLIRSKLHEKKPSLLLEYGKILMSLESYDEALKQYEAYHLLQPNDPQGEIGIESVKKIKYWKENPIPYSIENLKKINTRFSEFSPAYYDPNFQSIVFTSNREEAFGKEKDGWIGMDFSDLFFSRIDSKGEWTSPETIDDTETINTAANEGQAILNERFNTMYFTRCLRSNSNPMGCMIMEASKAGRLWSNPKGIELSKDSSNTIGHPSLSSDERTLIFSADFKNGFGGQDLYIAQRKTKNDQFKFALNLGSKINSSGDELFPYLRADSLLYFASNGRIGLGGLDIYRCILKNDTVFAEAENMGFPINTSADDFGIVFHPNQFESGFFSSNRVGGKGNEDIYSFNLPPIEFAIHGTVIDDYSLQPIGEMEILLIDSKQNKVSTKTNALGQFNFASSVVQKNMEYQLVFEKENYLRQLISESTKAIEYSKTFEEVIRLQRIPEKSVLLPEILFDLAKWDLKPLFEDSLRGLIATMDANPGLAIELGAHTDSQGNAEQNDVLSQKRAESVVNFLIERGIDPERLVAKGYGERVPRSLEKTISKNGFSFTQGTTLNEEYINQLSEKEKVLAHELNRRIEFRILRRNYQAKDYRLQETNLNIALADADKEKIVQIDLLAKDMWEMPAKINNFPERLIYTPLTQLNTMSVEFALKLLQAGIISKDDFEGDAEKLIQVGNIAHKSVIILKELSIGNKKTANVKVWIWHNSLYPFLINTETLNRFGKAEIDSKTNKTLIFK